LLNTLYERVAITVWRKRLQSALALLVRLFLTLLSGLKHRQPFRPATIAGRILLVDLSCFKRRKTDDDWLLHSAYDLHEGRPLQACESEQYQTKSLELFQFQPKDLVIADKGYSLAKNVAYASEQQTFLVLGFTPGTCPLLDRHGQPLDIVGWLRQFKQGTHCRTAWCEYEGKRYQVRIIAQIPGQEKTTQSRNSKEQQVSKKDKSQQDRLGLANRTLLLSTLPKRHWSPKRVIRLYWMTHWHIELLFRHMKQSLKLHLAQAKISESSEVRVCSSGKLPRSYKTQKPGIRPGSCSRSASSLRLRFQIWTDRQRSKS
jgi:hypothetical protein